MLSPIFRSSFFRSSPSHLRLCPAIVPIPQISTRAFRVQTRNMAPAPPAPTVPPGKFEWLVILPDHEGVLSKRMEVRPTHFAGLQKGIDEGFWKLGGALLEDVPKEGEGLKMMGSAMVCVAKSKEEVIEILKNDPYAVGGVWDMEKIQIYPFKCAIRIP